MRKGMIVVLFVFSLCAWGESFARLVATPGPTEPQSGSAMHHHSCCPEVHATMVVRPFVLLPASSLPCGDRLPCCVKQVPDSPPSLPATSGIERPTGETPFAASGGATQNDHSPSAADAFGVDPVSRYSGLSTVLRI